MTPHTATRCATTHDHPTPHIYPQMVDSEIRDDNVEVKYMDLQGVERRVGAKTRFTDVKQV